MHQDHFAKWAKLRRALDKKVDEYDNAVKTENGLKTKFKLQSNIALRAVLTLLQVVLVLWFRRVGMFVVPAAWFGWGSWWMSLPFAPAGRF